MFVWELRNISSVPFTRQVNAVCSLTGGVSVAPRSLLLLDRTSDARAPFYQVPFGTFALVPFHEPRERIDWLCPRRRRSFRSANGCQCSRPAPSHCRLHPFDTRSEESMDLCLFPLMRLTPISQPSVRTP